MGRNFRTIQRMTEAEHSERKRLAEYAINLSSPFALKVDGKDAAEAQRVCDAAWQAVSRADHDDYYINSIGLWAIIERFPWLLRPVANRPRTWES